MKLPNAERAFIDLEKLQHYCLNLNHPQGKHKAKLFKSLLGITANQSNLLRQSILEAIRAEEALLGKTDAFGKRYTVDFPMKGRKIPVIVRSSWIILVNEDFPRLTSCYII